jgi:hypothetical protein
MQDRSRRDGTETEADIKPRSGSIRYQNNWGYTSSWTVLRVNAAGDYLEEASEPNSELCLMGARTAPQTDPTPCREGHGRRGAPAQPESSPELLFSEVVRTSSEVLVFEFGLDSLFWTQNRSRGAKRGD